jgi:regulator of RNase E activity RraA
MSATKGSPNDPMLARFEELCVAVVCDAMDSLKLLSGMIHPAIHRVSGTRMVGRARTVDRMRAPANATQADIDPALGMGTQVVIDSSEPGTVVVIAAQGFERAGLVGDNMATRCVGVGLAGVIVDGAVRDIDSIREMGLTVFARATSPQMALGRAVTLAIDKPVVCGGIYIRPGDIVFGDADGVVVVPQARAEEILAEAERIEPLERQVRDFIAQGNTLVDAVKKYKVR